MPSQPPANIVLQERTCPVRAELGSGPGSQPGLWEKVGEELALASRGPRLRRRTEEVMTRALWLR